MSINVKIEDPCSGREAKVTSDGALKVSQVTRSSADISSAELTLHKQYRNFLVNSAGSEDMNVDGSVTPVEFGLEAQTSSIIWITSARFILNGVNLELDTNDFRRFGAATASQTPLANGVEFFLEQSGVETQIFASPVTVIGDFMNYADNFTNFINTVGAQEDFLSFDFNFDVSIALAPGSIDYITVRINDDLTLIDLFQVIVRGYQEII